MIGRFTFVVVAAAAGVGFATLLAYGQVQPGLSKTLQKCESGTGSALSKFVGPKTKCITKCVTGGRKTSGPYTDCFTPYGGDTLTCITGSLKGVEAKGGAAIAKVCAAADACPICYVNFFGDATSCTDASGANAWVEFNEPSYVDYFDSVFSCEEGIVGPPATPSKSEAKCEDGVAKALAKGWSAETKCLQKCNANLASGKITGSCDVFIGVTDPATLACMSDPAKLCLGEDRGRHRQGLLHSAGDGPRVLHVYQRHVRCNLGGGCRGGNRQCGRVPVFYQLRVAERRVPAVVL
jgi:hypothetical protein